MPPLRLNGSIGSKQIATVGKASFVSDSASLGDGELREQDNLLIQVAGREIRAVGHRRRDFRLLLIGRKANRRWKGLVYPRILKQGYFEFEL